VQRNTETDENLRSGFGSKKNYFFGLTRNYDHRRGKVPDAIMGKGQKEVQEKMVRHRE